MTIGDKVTWWSSFKDKTGRIVKVIPAGRVLLLRSLDEEFPDCTRSPIDGGTRDHESYIVRVPSGTKAKDKLYWPRVSKLVPVPEF